MIPKFKMLVKYEDGSERHESVQDCATLAGAEFEATNTVRFWNANLRATDTRKQLIRVYQVDGEEKSDEQSTKKESIRELGSNAINANDMRNRSTSSSATVKEKSVTESNGAKKLVSVVPVQRKLF
jgi:hypothetical protein